MYEERIDPAKIQRLINGSREVECDDCSSLREALIQTITGLITYNRELERGNESRGHYWTMPIVSDAYLASKFKEGNTLKDLTACFGNDVENAIRRWIVGTRRIKLKKRKKNVKANKTTRSKRVVKKRAGAKSKAAQRHSGKHRKQKTGAVSSAVKKVGKSVRR